MKGCQGLIEYPRQKLDSCKRICNLFRNLFCNLCKPHNLQGPGKLQNRASQTCIGFYNVLAQFVVLHIF